MANDVYNCIGIIELKHRCKNVHVQKFISVIELQCILNIYTCKYNLSKFIYDIVQANMSIFTKV